MLELASHGIEVYVRLFLATHGALNVRFLISYFPLS